jgi:hypothetical protein
MDSILSLFCSVDDFWQEFEPTWQTTLLTTTSRKRRRAGMMHPSEIMTLLILFHQSGYRTFKGFYCSYVCQHLRQEFPTLLSYGRFVCWIPQLLVPLCTYLHSHHGQDTGISFIDSTKLVVCHNLRIAQHRVFAAHAARGKTSTGWFFGFKLHLVVNDRGEILSWCVTPGNIDDRQPVPKLVRRLVGKLFADKGYISEPLAAVLREQGLHLITRLRKNMTNRLIDLGDKLLLRKRAIIESILDQLKNISQIEHARHRSPLNFLVNLVCGLIAYSLKPRKPSLHLAWNLLPASSVIRD